MLILKTLERMKVIVFDKTKLKFLISCREKDNKYEKNIKKVIFFVDFKKQSCRVYVQTSSMCIFYASLLYRVEHKSIKPFLCRINYLRTMHKKENLHKRGINIKLPN